jgi:hypothetical protein
MKNPTTPATPQGSAIQANPPKLFAALRDLLLAHKTRLLVVHDDADHVYANCSNLDAKGKPQFFGAVKVSGRKHSFHFMPVYDFPELLAGISPALKKRMQGKSCFNFDVLDQTLLHELQLLVEQGVARYTAAGRL